MSETASIILLASAIVAIIATLLGSSQQITAASIAWSDRPAINPDFDPDESCLFDIAQDKCIPGSEQECPIPQFGTNEDGQCFPKTLVDGEWKWVCPEEYHSEDDDESGQCYSNEGGCDYSGMVLIEREDGNGMRCAALYYICDDEEFRNEDFCLEWCEDRDNTMWCKPDAS